MSKINRLRDPPTLAFRAKKLPVTHEKPLFNF